jgi:hypothetical protein
MRVNLAALCVLWIIPIVYGGEIKIDPGQFELETIQGAEAHFGVAHDGPDNEPVLTTTVSKLGAEFWSVELRAPGITMESGKMYELKFRAKSMPGRYIYVVPERTEGNQSALATGTTLQIPEDWTECTVVFHATDSSTSGRLTLSSLSAVPASYWFSGFRLNQQ